jgi:hypothetical protein
MKLQSSPFIEGTPIGAMTHVPGVFGMQPIIRGEPLQVSRNRRGQPELNQGGRVIAFGENEAQILTFAAINHLKVQNYTMEPECPTKEPVVFTLD